MRLEPRQLLLLARLSDDCLDLPVSARAAWLSDTATRHPDLAPALRAMLSPPSNATAANDPLSLPAIGAALPAETDTHQPGDTVGPYRLVSLLGRGGMGAVWLAEQVDGRLQRQVALKLPLPGLAQGSWRRRFDRERDILAGLDHPGIAKLFDADVTSDGQPWLAMQYVAGESLVQHARTQRLPLAARVRLFAQLLEVVQHAHAALVVHRDLKPGNILVDEQGRPMLLDFGIAKLLPRDTPTSAYDGALTEFAAPALTLDYASPEQVAGLAIGTGTDVYSLGVVLYELLAGQRPYRLRRASRAAMEEAVLEQDVVPPSTRVTAAQAEASDTSARALARQLRGDLDAIVLKALRKPVDQRYATAQAFADDLQRWLRKEPVSAQPDALGYRTRRLLVRHWQAFAVGAALAAVLVTATVVSLAQARDARRASALARDEARQAEAVTAFLQNLFLGNTIGQADPAKARQRTAEQLMDDAADRIGTQLKDAPEQQVAMLDRLSNIYWQMRLYDHAAALSRQGAELAARHFGPGHPTTDHLQALQLFQAAAMGDTAPFAGPAGALLQRLPALSTSPREEDRANARLLLNALMNRDFELQPEAALEWARLSDAMMAAGEPRADMHQMVAVVYLQNLRLDDAARQFAIAHQSELAEGASAYVSDSHPAWYGRLEALRGHYADAEALMRESYARERHNDAGLQTLSDWALAVYARFLVDSGRAAQGLALARAGGPLASPALRQQLGDGARSVLASAHALSHLGRGEEALARADRGIALRLADAGPGVVPAPLATDRLEALLVLGRPAEALADIDRAEPQFAHGRASIAARALSEYRLRALIALGRAAEARAYLESRRAILSPPGGGPAEQARLAWLDAGILQLEKRPADAHRVLADALQRIAATSAADQACLREWVATLQGRMGDVALALGDVASARAAYDASLAAYAQVVDPHESLALARVASQLAHLAHGRGDAATARRLDTQASAIVARHPQQQGWGA